MLKKFSLIIAFMALILSFNNLYSQEDYYATVKFRAVDALGNADTVTFYVKSGATDGIDTAFGEVNIYGTEPQGDIDMRFVQRTDTNCIDKFYGYPLWQCPGEDAVNYVTLGPSDTNIDLKIEQI